MGCYKRLFIWVEGTDDSRFVESIIIPRFKVEYSSIHLVEYARMSSEKINSYIRSIKSMKAEYFLLADINDKPCVTAKKDEICRRIPEIEKDKVVVVIKEIESWYISGLKEELLRKFRIPANIDANSLTKEQFNRLIPKRMSRIDFMREILKHFSIEEAVRRNGSFKYFAEKYDLLGIGTGGR